VARRSSSRCWSAVNSIENGLGLGTNLTFNNQHPDPPS